jgi:hypothetical protein
VVESSPEPNETDAERLERYRKHWEKVAENEAKLLEQRKQVGHEDNDR